MKKLLLIVLCAFAVKYFYFEGHYSSSSYSSNEWYEGAKQLETATELATDNSASMLVYVYADWCGYCKKFEKEILYNAQISNDLHDVIKVRMNPDNDGLAKKFMQEHELTGFPSVLVKSSAGSSFKKLSPFTRGSGGWSLISGDEFVNSVRGRSLTL